MLYILNRLRIVGASNEKMDTVRYYIFSSYGRYVERFVVLFGAYLVTAKIGLGFYAVHGFATLIWPPAGIALAALFFWGYEMWPAVASAAFAVNFLTGAPAAVALGIAAGNTLEALAGVYIMRDLAGLNPMFERMQDSLGLILTGVTVTMLSATIGVASLVAGGIVMLSAVPQTWFAWWLGDSLAVLVLVPFLLRWLLLPFFSGTPAQIFERIAAFGTLAVADYLAFFNPFTLLADIPLAYIFAPLLWISLRTGPRGLTLANLLTALCALSSILSGHELFGQGNIIQSLFVGQIFVAVVSILFFIFTSIVEERKAAERLLETHVGTLEYTVEKISSADQAKTDFLAILAHELRNPLSPIVSALELIKINGMLPQNISLFETIEVQVHTLGRLLDDLLDITRISRKKFKLQKELVELQSILNHSLDTVRPFVKDRNHRLSVFLPQNPIWLDGDPIRITQIFVNILYNAAKYTNPGGKIIVTVKQQENGLVCIRIADTGIGILPHMFTKIFEPFVQASDSPSGIGTGLGIGLALTKRLVELHGGTITVASEGRGKGSAFSVTLPMLAKVQLPLSASSLYKVEWRSKEKKAIEKAYTILIVDDNKAAADGMQKLLAYSGHMVHVAYTGSAAVEDACVYHPEVVILDIGLPDMNGYDVARRLRSTQGSSLILIALSGYGQKQDKEKAFEAGFNHHLTKPIRVRDVEALLEKNRKN